MLQLLGSVNGPLLYPKSPLSQKDEAFCQISEIKNSIAEATIHRAQGEHGVFMSNRIWIKQRCEL